jgi:hydroxyacylglutathione hydrolase
MIQHICLTFNAFSENTYLIYTDSKECAVVDPGTSNFEERQYLKQCIEDNGLIVKYLLNTHAHIDHVLGNDFVKKTYQVPYLLHRFDLPVLLSNMDRAEFYGFKGYVGADPDAYLDEGNQVKLGNEVLDILFVPGHAPGHIAFYHKNSNQLWAGDVLFKRSIGRTDFPYCSHADLMNSIKNKLFLLPEQTIVYPGHGPETTIGYEKLHNPYLIN